MARIVILIFLFITFSLSPKIVLAQHIHGPSLKYSFSILEKHSIGLGYHFAELKDNWTRPSHSYYVEYLPEFRAIGISANVQTASLAFKAGLDASFRSSNAMGKTYFNFFPNIGIDIIDFDISFGPDFITTPSEGKSVGFKVHLKIHPKLFNRKSVAIRRRN